MKDPLKLRRRRSLKRAARLKPHPLEKAAAAGLLLLVLLTFAATSIQSLVLPSFSWLSSAILPAVLVDLTNEERKDDAYGALVRNARLDEAARLKAEDMASKEYFAHDSPEGFTPWHWFELAGYAYAHAGENLAVHFTDSDEVVDAWMKSPGHRANILNANYTEIGIGTARGSYKGKQTIFVVQMFGTPLQASAEKAPAKETATPNTEEAARDAQIAGAQAPEQVRAAEEMATTSPHAAAEPLPDVSADPAPEASFESYSSFLEEAAVRPHRVITIMYAFIALLILGALLASIFIEMRRRHPFQVAYAIGLLVLMWGALYVHSALTAGALIV